MSEENRGKKFDDLANKFKQSASDIGNKAKEAAGKTRAAAGKATAAAADKARAAAEKTRAAADKAKETASEKAKTSREAKAAKTAAEPKEPKTSKAPKEPRAKRARKPLGLRILGAFGTLCLVGVLTLAIFVGIFLKYIDTAMRGHVEVDLTEYTQEVSTELYYKDPDTGEWVMYQTLFANENRIWVDSENIPEYLKQATIAVEDKRFNEHEGVDWKGTVRAILSTVTGGDVQGGSTITQQLIKNITGDKQNTVKRKITEIYRALALEEEGYSKDELLTIYLNTIFLGNQCYGVQTAADMYFGKDVTELTLAECASLISITNNPSMYDPLRADWCREENRNRQLWVLEKMLEQGMIDQATHDAAVAEEIVFTNGYTCFGNSVTPPGSSGDSGEEEVVSTANNSYFTDAVIEDVAYALIDLYGIKDDPADSDGNIRTAFDKAVNMVYGKGLKIYTTQNPKFQEIAEDVYENTDYTEVTDSYGQPLQSAITVMDPYTGDIVAMVGGTGAKEYDRGWNWATETRQCGSAIKPISTYAPALDNGTITAASAVDDYPLYLPGHGVYPRNSYSGFDGLVTVQQALRVSSNCAAVTVNRLYGTAASYNFMVENLGFTTLTYTDSEQVGNMALGGLEYGVTTEEMAAAFSAFVNDGIYTTPRTFSRVETNDGELLIDNTVTTNVAMKETTAYLMRGFLQDVVSSGTGYNADFYGQPVAGKTGTTDNERDYYFVGFTPYYCAAVWCGYKSNEVIRVGGVNPAPVLWEEVMSRIHEGMERGYFNDCGGLTQVSVCADSGMYATDACAKDPRGSRVRSVTVAADNVPKGTCTLHKVVKYCEEGKHIATEFCPLKSVKEVALVDYNRELITTNGGAIAEDLSNLVAAADNAYILKVASLGEKCPVHQEDLPADQRDQDGDGLDDITGKPIENKQPEDEDEDDIIGDILDSLKPDGGSNKPTPDGDDTGDTGDSGNTGNTGDSGNTGNTGSTDSSGGA